MSLLLHSLTNRQLSEIAAGSLLHGYIFHGPVGMGKATTAYDLAKRLNCLKGGDDACTVCRQIDAGNYPNVIVISPHEKPSIGIDQVRALGQLLALQPYVKTGRRVVIIDEAQAMTREAQNALLKFIEEPPPATLLILVAPSLQTLLPTVVSRLGAVYFLPLEETAVAAWLMAERNASSMDATTAAAQAGGRPGVAVGSLDVGNSMTDEANATAAKLIHGTVFARLIEVARMASAKEDANAVADALHALATQNLRNELLSPEVAGHIMAAAERMKRYLKANVTPRSALERFVLEVV
jgi:DNA polymerase-3 subunit delta'